MCFSYRHAVIRKEMLVACGSTFTVLQSDTLWKPQIVFTTYTKGLIMMMCCVQSLLNSPTFLAPPSLRNIPTYPYSKSKDFKCCRGRRFGSKKAGIVNGFLLPVDPWAPNIDSQSIASQLFAVSLFPYIGFLYFITKSKSAPKLTLFGFYFLLAFVGATIPAGIYAKVHYGTSLSNVDWLHGGAESLLTLTNLFIVMGLREGLRKAKDAKQSTPDISRIKEEEKTSI